MDFFCVSFLSRVDELNNLASLQCIEHCNANTEATGSNSVEAQKNFFSGYFAIA